MKPYRSIPIKDCGEPLVPIPQGIFGFFDPHPYVAAGAPYGKTSPWMLRQSILEDLKSVQIRLQKLRPGWFLMFFDAYRPNEVQEYMVQWEFGQQASQAGLSPDRVTDEQRTELFEKVYRLWAIPSADPATPPPHSTGAVVDITLADENGQEVNMGSPIDENSDRSNSDHFANASDEAGKRANANRELLNDVMCAEGFQRNPREWWHFSKGDQAWTWYAREAGREAPSYAIYGRADLV